MILQRESQSAETNTQKQLLRPENAGQLSGVVFDGMTSKLKCVSLSFGPACGTRAASVLLSTDLPRRFINATNKHQPASFKFNP